MLRFDVLNDIVSKFFELLVRFASKHAVSFILLPLLVTALFGIRLLSPFKVQPDYVDFFMPDRGRAVDERASLESYFPINDNDTMYALRRNEYTRMGFITATAKSNYSMIDLAPLIEMLHLWKAVIDIAVYDYHETFFYKSLCVKIPQSSECVLNPLLGLAYYRIGDIFNLSYPIHHVSGFGDIFLGNMIGGISWYPNDTRHVVYHVESVLLPYMLKHSSDKDQHLAQQWEIKVSNFLSGINSTLMDVSWYTYETLNEIMAQQSKMVLVVTIAIVAAIAIIAIVASLTCNCNKIRNQPFAALFGTFSTVLGILLGICILLCAEVPFSTVAKLAGLAAFLIGIQNYFFNFNAWQESTHLSSTSERLAFCCRESLPILTITTLVDIVGFIAALFCDIPAIRSFAIYGAVCIFTVFLLHATFFVGVLILCARREQDGKHYLNCDPVQRNVTKNYNNEPVMQIRRAILYDDEDTGKSGRLPTRFLSGTYARFLASWVGKILSLLLFCGFLGLGGWGWSQAKVGIDTSTVFPKSSPAQRGLILRDKYFSDYCDFVHVWFDKLERYQPASGLLEKLQSEVNRFEDTNFTGSAENWIDIVRTFAVNRSLSLPSENSQGDLVYLMKRFYWDDSSIPYRNDFVFNSNNQLTAARFAVRLRNCQQSNQSAIMHYLRGLADTSSLSANVYHDTFRLAELDEATQADYIRVAAACIGAIVVACLLVIPVPVCAIFVPICVVAVHVGLVGFMSLWNVNFDISSLLTPLTSIGYSVNFPMFVAWQFSKSKIADKLGRIETTLWLSAVPILLSSVCGLVAVGLMSILDNYAAHVIVKQLILVIIFSAFMSLVVLPVLLLLAVPSCMLTNSGGSSNSIYREQ